MKKDAENWVIKETESSYFGDKRLTKRYGDILDCFWSAPKASIPASCRSWKETIGAYRFFNHEDVMDSAILSAHKEATLDRIKKERLVLIPQDTTEMDFTGRKPIKGMGYLSQKNSHGFYLHPSIAVTPACVCLGVVDMQTWTRDQLGMSKSRNSKPIEEKETYCWLKGYEAANEIALAAPETKIISVADREGDIDELLEKMPSEQNRAYWLVRSQHNRSVLNEENDVFESRLRETVSATKAIGEIEFR